jgi:hypothetical protein
LGRRNVGDNQGRKEGRTYNQMFLEEEIAGQLVRFLALSLYGIQIL